jgi:hypothetical protein
MATSIITERVALLRSPFSVDQTALGEPTPLANRATVPNGTGTFKICDSDSLLTSPRMVIVPYGVATPGVAEQWFSIRLFGWRRALLAGSPDLWMFRPLTELRCRLATYYSNFGVTGTLIPPGHVPCDRIEIADGYRVGPTGAEVDDGVPGYPAEAMVACRGSVYGTGQIILMGAAAGNFLWGGL